MNFKKTDDLSKEILNEDPSKLLVKYNLTNPGNLLYQFLDYHRTDMEKIISYYHTIYKAKKITVTSPETKELPLLPNVESLVCKNKQMTSLPDGMVNLKKLDCKDNQLTRLPDGMTSLETLDCKNNSLTSLPNDMYLLKKLYCDNNQLTSLPNGMSTLETLYCKGNQLTRLPVGMSSIKYLQCEDSQLTNLPENTKTFFKNLECEEPDDTMVDTLHCENNQLSALPDGICSTINYTELITCDNNNLKNLQNETLRV